VNDSLVASGESRAISSSLDQMESENMNRNPILFRCDGTPATGWEPFYQCMVLAAAMQRRRRGTHFLSRLEPFALATAVHRGNNEWRGADHPVGTPEDLTDTIREVRRIDAASVVLACPGLSAEYVKELQCQTGVQVTVLDSEAGMDFPNRLVINPLLTPGLKAYSRSSRTQMLLGPKYPLVRAIFRRQRPMRSVEPPQPFRAMIAFGDDDFQGQSIERALQLLGTSRIDKVSVVVRIHHPQIDELKDLVKQHSDRLEVISEPNEIAKRVGRVHFALTSGDSFTLELACVGIPQLILAQTTRHAKCGQKLDEEGGATYLGEAPAVTNNDLRSAVQLILSDPVERLGMSRCARMLVDGRGPDRMVNAMELLMHADHRVLTQSMLRVA